MNISTFHNVTSLKSHMCNMCTSSPLHVLQKGHFQRFKFSRFFRPNRSALLQHSQTRHEIHTKVLNSSSKDPQIQKIFQRKFSNIHILRNNNENTRQLALNGSLNNRWVVRPMPHTAPEVSWLLPYRLSPSFCRGT